MSAAVARLIAVAAAVAAFVAVLWFVYSAAAPLLTSLSP